MVFVYTTSVLVLQMGPFYSVMGMCCVLRYVWGAMLPFYCIVLKLFIYKFRVFGEDVTLEGPAVSELSPLVCD